jgi:VanZ family protein
VRRLPRWVPPVLWAALLYALSSQPRLPPGPDVPNFDKVAHYGAYLVFGVLLARAPVSVVFAAAIGILYGASDEVHQMFVPGRSPSVLDWAADALGVLSGVFIHTRFRSRRAPKPSPSREADLIRT